MVPHSGFNQQSTGDGAPPNDYKDLPPGERGDDMDPYPGDYPDTGYHDDQMQGEEHIKTHGFRSSITDQSMISGHLEPFTSDDEMVPSIVV